MYFLFISLIVFSLGSCVDKINAFDCTCLAGFSGSLCEKNINECLLSSCGNGWLKLNCKLSFGYFTNRKLYLKLHKSTTNITGKKNRAVAI